MNKSETGAPLDFSVPPKASGKRIDRFLANRLVDRYSRTKLQALIRDGFVKVNGSTVPCHYRLHEGEKIIVQPPKERAQSVRGENIPLQIVHEDDDLIVVNKPAGMVVHPACGNPDHTLVNALIYHTRHHLSSYGGEVRAGIVHRLDKDTSGVLVVAKTDEAHRYLARQFKCHEITRVYEACVKGVVRHDEFRCSEPVGRAFLNRKKVIIKPSGGKDAATSFKVLRRFRKATLLEAYPETGRTHQIRVHLAFLGYPVLGDRVYGVSSPYIHRHALHAKKLGFSHPGTKRQVEFQAQMPNDMQLLVENLNAET